MIYQKKVQKRPVWLEHLSLRHVKNIGKALSFSVLNQVISSGTRFILGLYLVRILDPSEFGLFGIGFAISLFYAGIGNAIFLTQMVVHTPDKAPEERILYAGRMFILVLIFCFLTVNIAFLLYLFGKGIKSFTVDYGGFILAITFASITFLMKDFFVRHFYNIRKESQALIINISLALSLLFVLVVFYCMNYKCTVNIALFVYAFAHAVGAVAGFLNARLPITKCKFIQIKLDFKEAWEFGRWALVQNFVYWLRTQAYTYVSVIFAGPSAVGLINAARLLVSPVLFVIPAITQIMLPRLASVRNEGYRALKITKITACILLTLSLLYFSVLVVNLNQFIPVVLGMKYVNEPLMVTLIIAWCLIMCVQVVQASFGSLVQAFKLFRIWAISNFAAALVAVTFAGFLSTLIGIPGALLGTLMGEISLLIIIMKTVKTESRHNSDRYLKACHE